MFDHVVLISLDTLRSDCLDASPSKLWPDRHGLKERPLLPVLDDLAAKGAFFPNCITAAPYTSAAHASFFTGRWPLRHGVFEFFNRKLSAPTVFGRARRLGYKTLFKTDFPIILGSFLGFDRDIDKYVVEDDDEFLSHLERHDRAFSFVHFSGLHTPYGFHNLKYGGRDYADKVAALEAEIPDLPPASREQLVETYYDDRDLELLARYRNVIDHHYREGRHSRLFELYLEGARYFSERRLEPFLTRLFEILGDRRFLIVLFGDHGEEYDEESFGHFNTLAEGVLRVPVIFLGSDIRQGLHRRRIRSVDVAPSILDLLGDRAASRLKLDGVSLVETLRRGDEYPLRPAFAQAYVSDLAELMPFHRRTLGSGKKTGALRHVRYKEAVYDENFKLSRQHYRYTAGVGSRLESCPTRSRLEEIDQDTHLHRVRDGAVERRLAAMLDRYNELRRVGGKGLTVSDQIRGQLRNMGYTI